MKLMAEKVFNACLHKQNLSYLELHWKKIPSGINYHIKNNDYELLCKEN